MSLKFALLLENIVGDGASRNNNSKDSVKTVLKEWKAIRNQ